MTELPEDLVSIAERLERERPVPTAAFRGELRRSLGSAADGAAGRRPASLWPRVGALAAVGAALLAMATAGLAGTGPLAPSEAGKAAAVAQR
ncbi:MAG: hypothetical protein H0V29_01160 [Thermoleophilaceae bacterium]|nr:hypothetical protein [Thermoleophilaceae bacterium]